MGEKWTLESAASRKFPLLHPLAGASPRVFLDHAFPSRGFDSRARLQRLIAWSAQAARLLPTAIETARNGTAIRRHQLEKPPVFLIGHWRSGTTHLHNLMSRDPRFGYLDFGGTAMPLNMIGPEVQIARRFIGDTLPETRGYDNVKLSLDEPQEEEMALGNLNPIGYYNIYYFPQETAKHTAQALFFEGTTPEERTRFRQSYEYLVRKLSLVKEGRQLLFKNPPSTARMPMILEMFPQAKFVHIARNPWPVFSSNCKKFPRLYNAFAWQPFQNVDIPGYTLDTYARLMQRYFENRDRLRLPPNQLVESRYEDLTEDPIREVRRIYEQLELEASSEALDRITGYVESLSGYRANVHTIDEEQAAQIRDRWSFAFDELDYPREPPTDIEIRPRATSSASTVVGRHV